MSTGNVSYREGVYEKGEIDLNLLVQELFREDFAGEAGAVALFIGRVKQVSRDGSKVSHLEIEAYREMANRTIQNICREVREKYGLRFSGIWHLVGRFGPGEPLVLVAAAGKGREEVFTAIRELVHRYKTEPPLFKKEVYEDGSYRWIEE